MACKSELKLCIISVTLGYKDCRPRLLCIHRGYRQKLPIVVYPFSPVAQKTLSPLTNLLSVSIQLCCAFHRQLLSNICLNSFNSDSLKLLDWWRCPRSNLNKALRFLLNMKVNLAPPWAPLRAFKWKNSLCKMGEKVKRDGGRRLRIGRVCSQMGSSAVQKSLIANSVQSLGGPPSLGPILLRRLRGLVHQSQGSEPFTNFPRDLPGRQPQCWASLLNWLENLRTRGRHEGGGMDAIHGTGTGDSLPFHFIGGHSIGKQPAPKPSPPQDAFQQFTCWHAATGQTGAAEGKPGANRSL